MIKYFRHAVIIGAMACIATTAHAGSKVADAGCIVPKNFAEARNAIANCSDIIKRTDIGPSDRIEAITMRARNETWTGALAAAANDFEEAIRLSPNDAELRWRRGWVAYHQNNMVYAISLAEQAIAIIPQSEAYDLMGKVAARAGDITLAKWSYDEAVKLRPEIAKWRYNRFGFYSGIGAQREAMAEIDGLLALDAKQIDRQTIVLKGKDVTYRLAARVERANLLNAMGRTADAERAFSELVADDPGAVSYGYRGWYYLDQRRLHQGRGRSRQGARV